MTIAPIDNHMNLPSVRVEIRKQRAKEKQFYIDQYIGEYETGDATFLEMLSPTDMEEMFAQVWNVLCGLDSDMTVKETIMEYALTVAVKLADDRMRDV